MIIHIQQETGSRLSYKATLVRDSILEWRVAGDASFDPFAVKYWGLVYPLYLKVKYNMLIVMLYTKRNVL